MQALEAVGTEERGSQALLTEAPEVSPWIVFQCRKEIVGTTALGCCRVGYGEPTLPPADCLLLTSMAEYDRSYKLSFTPPFDTVTVLVAAVLSKRLSSFKLPMIELQSGCGRFVMRRHPESLKTARDASSGLRLVLPPGVIS